MTLDRLINWFLACCIAIAAGMFIGELAFGAEPQPKTNLEAAWKVCFDNRIADNDINGGAMTWRPEDIPYVFPDTISAHCDAVFKIIWHIHHDKDQEGVARKAQAQEKRLAPLLPIIQRGIDDPNGRLLK